MAPKEPNRSRELLEAKFEWDTFRNGLGRLAAAVEAGKEEDIETIFNELDGILGTHRDILTGRIDGRYHDACLRVHLISIGKLSPDTLEGPWTPEGASAIRRIAHEVADASRELTDLVVRVVR
jgi:hypothetical protein